jgi:hypothetical protein
MTMRAVVRRLNAAADNEAYSVFLRPESIQVARVSSSRGVLFVRFRDSEKWHKTDVSNAVEILHGRRLVANYPLKLWYDAARITAPEVF